MKKFLHIFIFALILTILFCVSASALEWTDANGIKWSFSVSTDTSGTVPVKVATITGATPKTGDKRTPELNIPSEVYDAEGNKYVVTKIGANAFRCVVDSGDQNNISKNTVSGDKFLAKKYFGKLTIPNTVVEIGANAFEYSAIYGTVVIPDSVKIIGNKAFRGCVGLDTVVFPSSLTANAVPDYCFEGCKALVEFKSTAKLEKYGTNAFYGCEALLYFNRIIETKPVLDDDGKQKLDDAGNPVFEEIVESLFKYAKSIGSSAFQNTSISGELDLSALESLGGSAFYNCNFLTKVTLGSCAFVRSAFSYDESKVSTLRDIVISPSNEGYCSINGVVFDKKMTAIYYYCPAKVDQEYSIPDSVVTIKEWAFYKSKLRKVTIGSGVTAIDSNAFKHSALDTFFVPSNVKTVGSNVIANCPNITWVIFDTGVTTVKTDSVSTSSCPFLKSRAYVKNGTNTISGGTAYSPNSDCITDLDLDNHFYGYIDTNPTCDTTGIYKCCLCYDEAPAKALGHTGKIIGTSSLSCTTNNSFTVDCERCLQITETIIEKAPGHSLSAPVVINEAKYQYTYSRCENCKNIILSTFTTTPYKSGDINGDGAINAVDVTFLTKLIAGSAVNVNRYACDIDADGFVTAKDLMLLKQFVTAGASTITPNDNTCSNHVRISTIVIAKENCTDGGYYVYFCAECGEIIDEKQVEKLGHSFVDVTITPSTCSAEGLMDRTCSICLYNEKAAIPTVEHIYTWWMLSDDELDFQYGYCSVCNNLGHKEVDRGVLDDVVASIPTDFELYCTAESRSILRPIVANAKKALTQEQVDLCIQELRKILPSIQYKVTDIPVVYLESRAPVYPKTSYYVSANIIYAYKDKDGNLKSITDAYGEMKVRGNATAGVAAKLPFNIKFSRDVDLGMGYGKKYSLLANALDTSTIRNAVAFEFAYALGLDYTCKYQMVEVYHDGKYKGCYNLVTPIEIGEDRVDIDEEKDVIIHLSYKNGSEDAAFPSPIFGLKLMRLEEPSEYTPYTKSQMIRVMHQADFAILSGDTDEMAKVMDMDSMLKYFIFHEYVKDMDMIWDSTRFYIEAGKLHGGPCWDLDISQGNVSIQTARNDNFDEHSGYHYWNQNIIYGDIVTRAELDALGRLSSAIGPWADAYWVNDRDNGTSNPTLKNGQRRWWYSYMIEYSSEFRTDVAEYIKANESLFKSIYQPVTDPTTGKTSDCVIDYLAFGPAGEAIIRNYTNADAPFGASTHPNNLTCGLDNTHQASIDYLKSWWKIRSEWLYDYYTTNFLPEATQ